MQRAALDLSEVKRKITYFIRKKVEESQTDGVLVALDGEIDSAVTAYLCVEALGSRRVTGLIMPDLRTAARRTYRTPNWSRMSSALRPDSSTSLQSRSLS